MADKHLRKNRWYFGGLASCGAVLITHPLDLLKVHLQTQQEGQIKLVAGTKAIIQREGFFKLYSGISASIARQLTYSLTRFAAYDIMKNKILKNGETFPFYKKCIVAGAAGALGGFVGTPADLINVRMQNDVKLPIEQRKNYKHAIDGFIRIIREEGFRKLYSGLSTAVPRAFVMNIGQLAFYDEVKARLLGHSIFEDNFPTHLLSSLIAGTVSTFLTQPLDVVKTRQMTGDFKNIFSVINYTAKLGPMGFYKGVFTSFVRLAPQTIITFLLMEHLRLNFGKE